MEFYTRNFFARILAYLLIFMGFVRRAKEKVMKGECMLAVYFHKPSREEFEAMVKWLIKNKFQFLSVSDIDQIIQQKLSFPKGAVILTVDDGWLSNEENIVAIAEKYGVPVTIFVSTEPVEEGTYWWSYAQRARRYSSKYLSLKALKRLKNENRLLEIDEMKKKMLLPREAMTVDQLKRIARSAYVTIGAHTHTHPVLPNCSREQVLEELRLGRQKLEDWTGKEVPFFAFPNGDFSLREIQALDSLQYRVAFNSLPKYITPEILDYSFELPRFGYLEGASFEENICRIVGVWRPLMLWFRFPYWKKCQEVPQLVYGYRPERTINKLEKTEVL